MQPPTRLHTALLRLREHGWTITLPRSQRALPDTFLGRYGWVPEHVRELLCSVDLAASPDETRWLITAWVHAGEGDVAFAADEFERLSLDAAADDPSLVASIRAFWDQHLCLCIDVADGYQFYALAQRGLKVVVGREPEFEDVSDFAPDLLGFLEVVADSTM